MGGKLYKKMSGAYGTSGYSMGGGATVLASMADKTLKSSVGLAPWTVYGVGAVTTPTLHFCGDLDVVADCSQAQAAYDAVPASTPKMMITISGCDHLACWFGPADSTDGISGGWALAFHKVYLENDLRWKPLLMKKPMSGTVQTTIQ
jgi:hypothetical protein